MGPINDFIVLFTRSAVVMGRRYSSMFTVPPIETVPFLCSILLSMVSLAEKWNSRIPVSVAM